MAKTCNKCGRGLVNKKEFYCEECRIIVRQEYIDKENGVAKEVADEQARIEKEGVEFSLTRFAETRRKYIKDFISWLDFTSSISGVLMNCHGIFEKLNPNNDFVYVRLGICRDELIIYEDRTFSKPDYIYALKLSNIIWDDLTFSTELGFINFKYFNTNIGNMATFTIGKLWKSYWNLNQFVDKVNELIPDAIKIERCDENVRYFIFERTYTTVKFDHISELFELYKVDSRSGSGGRMYELIKSVRYADIINCELTENNVSVSKGGIAAAAVGGALFGGVGAIVGSNVGSKTSQEVMGRVDMTVTINNINNPVITIPLFPESVNTSTKTGAEYEEWQKNVNEILGLFSVVLKNNSNIKDKSESKNNDTSQVPQINTGADDLRKYKELLDDGIITKEEFDEVKKRILAL